MAGKCCLFGERITKNPCSLITMIQQELRIAILHAKGNVLLGVNVHVNIFRYQMSLFPLCDKNGLLAFQTTLIQTHPRIQLQRRVMLGITYMWTEYKGAVKFHVVKTYIPNMPWEREKKWSFGILLNTDAELPNSWRLRPPLWSTDQNSKLYLRLWIEFWPEAVSRWSSLVVIFLNTWLE